MKTNIVFQYTETINNQVCGVSITLGETEAEDIKQVSWTNETTRMRVSVKQTGDNTPKISIGDFENYANYSAQIEAAKTYITGTLPAEVTALRAI